jgi:hypothetical protein
MAVKTRKKKRTAKRRKARSVAAPARPKRRRKSRRVRKASRKARRASFRRKSSGRIRPVVIVSGSGFRRPAKSKYFSGPTRINRRRRGRARKNPFSGGALSIRKVFSKNTLMRYVGLGGGIGLGALFSRFLNTGVVPFSSTALIPATMVATLQKARPFHGLIHILVGVTIAAKIRNPIAKDVGAGLAALGGFDLLMQLLSKMGVTNLPTFSGMNVDFMGMNVDAPRVVRVAGNGYSEDGDEFIDSLDT